LVAKALSEWTVPVSVLAITFWMSVHSEEKESLLLELFVLGAIFFIFDISSSSLANLPSLGFLLTPA
jgi:hypothetical protein